VLSVGRIESVKRVDLIVAALAQSDPGLRLLVAGDGTQRENVERETHAAGVADRVTFLGSVRDDTLIELYAGALAVVYPPYDEDFGYVTLEAFLACKPVVTCTDSGGPNEFVVDGVNGYVCEPSAPALADALGRLAADRGRAAALGDAGREVARRITWDGVIDTLIG
jgi:glycosyltransferase involved in cell wall biosynthesis